MGESVSIVDFVATGCADYYVRQSRYWQQRTTCTDKLGEAVQGRGPAKSALGVNLRHRNL